MRGNKRSFDSNFHNLKICRQAAQPKGVDKPKKLRLIVAVQQDIQKGEQTMQDGGFYWLRMRDANDVTIGQLLVGRWFLVGNTLPFLDTDVTVIGERLVQPGETS